MRFYYYQEECVPYYFRISDQPTDFERIDVLIHYIALVKPVIGLIVTHGWGYPVSIQNSISERGRDTLRSPKMLDLTTERTA